VLDLREAHISWGPRKLKRVLERDEAGQRWPAASTIGVLLKRSGMIVGRKKRFKTPPYTQPLAHADGANRLWCADFKGWFRSGNGERIDPLTITDAYSRYLLRCQGVEKMDTAKTVRDPPGYSKIGDPVMGGIPVIGKAQTSETYANPG
jgi:putative transposase